jgi:hypothetical protein
VEREPSRAAEPAAERPRRAAIVRAKDRDRDVPDGPAPRPRIAATDGGWASWPGLPLDTRIETGERTRPRLEEIRKRWRQRVGLQHRDARDCD